MYSDDEKVVLCGASAYEQKYYFNQDFASLPQSVQDELHIMCVMFTVEIGGIFTMWFDSDGSLQFETEAVDADAMYDEIGGALRIKQYQEEKKDLLESLELYYRVFFLGEEVPYRQGEPADITAPDGYASTWVGTGCVSDNANTYFIGHNPGVFERVMDLEIGDKVTVFDDDGDSRTYYVFDALFLPNGSNYFVYESRIAPTGETITLQTCTGDNQQVRCVMAR